VVIGAGNPSANITITPVDDAAVEGNETVMTTVTSGTAGLPLYLTCSDGFLFIRASK
ncbi:hypothetical protein LCGC14_1865660, partial [marine sediment metagenome]